MIINKISEFTCYGTLSFRPLSYSAYEKQGDDSFRQWMEGMKPLMPQAYPTG